MAKEKDRSPVQPDSTEPVTHEDGKFECPLCGRKVDSLETGNQHRVGCKECLANVTKPIINDLYGHLNVGRNAPCICGKKDANGKPVKFKKCCGSGK